MTNEPMDNSILLSKMRELESRRNRAIAEALDASERIRNLRTQIGQDSRPMPRCSRYIKSVLSRAERGGEKLSFAEIEYRVLVRAAANEHVYSVHRIRQSISKLIKCEVIATDEGGKIVPGPKWDGI